MRLVVATDPGVLELNWMWLPTWLGHNMPLRQQMEKELSKLVQGRPMTDAFLDEVHQLVVDFLCKSFPDLVGLRDYLDSIKFVEVKREG